MVFLSDRKEVNPATFFLLQLHIIIIIPIEVGTIWPRLCWFWFVVDVSVTLLFLGRVVGLRQTSHNFGEMWFDFKVSFLNCFLFLVRLFCFIAVGFSPLLYYSNTISLFSLHLRGNHDMSTRWTRHTLRKPNNKNTSYRLL